MAASATPALTNRRAWSRAWHRRWWAVFVAKLVVALAAPLAGAGTRRCHWYTSSLAARRAAPRPGKVGPPPPPPPRPLASSPAASSKAARDLHHARPECEDERCDRDPAPHKDRQQPRRDALCRGFL